MNKQKTIAALTLGCKVNAYDTQAMLELFSAKGYEITDFSNRADVYLVNTCTVTNLGDKKSRQMLRRAMRQNPEAFIVAAGCYAQAFPEEVEKIEGINLIIGTKDRSKIVELVEACEKEEKAVSRVGDIRRETDFENLRVNRLGDKARAYLKIQEGCDNFCSYCIVPYARGSVRSRLPEDILQEAEVLAKNGFKEIVLTGIQVASYGKDLMNANLADILKKVHEPPGIERIRLSSVESGLFTDSFLRTLEALPKVCDHFHLSLQSGCDATLSRMNRRYTAREYARTVGLIRGLYPRVSLTTDVIVGFPGETEEEFRESYAFVREMRFAGLHVFPYSPKKGTAAASFSQQVPLAVKQKRFHEMWSLGQSLSGGFLEGFLGQTLPVLFESRVKDSEYEGHASNYSKVRASLFRPAVNQILPVTITALQGTTLMGTLAY